MLVLLLLASIFFHSSADEDLRFTLCTTTTPTYTPNSTFSTTLTTALTTLQNSTATGFTTTTATNPLTNSSVTALALCRSSLSPEDCQTCIAEATLGIRRECPNNTAAQVWYTYCTLRYSPINFLNQSDDSIAFRLYDTRNAPNNTSYDQKVNMLMKNLSQAAGASDKRAAVGRTTLLGSLNIYGYVDCTRDISGGDCTTCLLGAVDWIPSCCLGKWAGWVVTPTCNIQFNMDPVHADWINNPPEINTNFLSPAPETETETVAPEYEGGLGGGGGGGGKERKVVVGVVLSFVGIVGVVVVIWWKWRGVRGNRVEESQETVLMSEDMGLRSVLYNLEVLVAATNNFSQANRIGGGGFGTVYRGEIPGGQEIAVKKLEAGSGQGIEEFYNEVKVLLKMQHRNLVRLLGCFIQVAEMMLVYEYLPNKSLDHFLFDKSRSALLDWTKRFNIIMGVARGLLYLHEDSQLRIIHRDIKASNILLDEKMNPKISDFGLAKLFKDEESRARTRRIVGTFGYMAPEYAVRGVLSTKSDVFSFGVFMLETISGRKNFDISLDDERKQLLNFTKRLEREGRLMELVDVTLGSFPPDDVLRCIHIGLLCCQERVQDRPTMSLALIMLTDNQVTLPHAGRLGYHDGTDNTTLDNAAVNPPSYTRNSITVSLANGR